MSKVEEMRTKFKTKIEKLKQTVGGYQKKYHDIDIKFMHEEISRLNIQFQNQKQVIHEQEQQL